MCWGGLEVGIMSSFTLSNSIHTPNTCLLLFDLLTISLKMHLQMEQKATDCVGFIVQNCTMQALERMKSEHEQKDPSACAKSCDELLSHRGHSPATLYSTASSAMEHKVMARFCFYCFKIEAIPAVPAHMSQWKQLPKSPTRSPCMLVLH